MDYSKLYIYLSKKYNKKYFKSSPFPFYGEISEYSIDILIKSFDDIPKYIKDNIQDYRFYIRITGSNSDEDLRSNLFYSIKGYSQWPDIKGNNLKKSDINFSYPIVDNYENEQIIPKNYYEIKPQIFSNYFDKLHNYLDLNLDKGLTNHKNKNPKNFKIKNKNKHSKIFKTKNKNKNKKSRSKKKKNKYSKIFPKKYRENGIKKDRNIKYMIRYYLKNVNINVTNVVMENYFLVIIVIIVCIDVILLILMTIVIVFVIYVWIQIIGIIKSLKKNKNKI